MKKILLACSVIVGSIFFAAAQFDVGGVKVNVGQQCATINGKPMCYNPSTGAWQIVTGNGVGVSGNANTGQVNAAGTIGGVRLGGSAVLGGTNTGGTSQGNQNYSGVLGLLALARTLVVQAVPFLIGVALLAFFWFLVEFIWKGRESGDAQEQGKKGMLYSIIAIFVMVSIWGIIGFMGNVLGIGQGGGIPGFKLPGEQ
jgi:hypothetical protein